ncbi:MAG TPA: class I SAM-dependent methyltransferase [Burkholderiaceae bacterium]|nr:class I SAM-dependent methyltransferase [Burkholderiaceae bacterium]
MTKDLEHSIVWTDDKVARLWNFYSRSRVVNDLYFSKVYGRFVLKRAALRGSKALRLLDFGCGPGYMWDHIRGTGLNWRYTGLDFSADSVAALQARCAGESGFEGVVHASCLPSSLPPASFDAILLLEVVEHLDDDRLHETIRETRRLLKPGGRLIVTTPHAEDLQQEMQFCPECGAVFHKWQHVRSWTSEGLQAVMTEGGLAHERTWIGHWSDHWWYGWLFNRAARSLLHRRTDPHMMAVFAKPQVG